MSWYLFDRSGSKLKIPADPFVFWGNLCEHVILSAPDATEILWCFAEEDLCFSSTLLDSDMWQAPCISGQWKVSLSQEGNGSKCRLSLLRSTAQFPTSNACPAWLTTLRKMQVQKHQR